ncbi:MAG TPA: aminodeoxychorismate synthase component I [Aeromonas salmonicida]|nr:aminodeoxychorismate synthase component I [Aeromonas salmonicida]
MLYIDVNAVTDFQLSAVAQTWWQLPETQQTLAQARATEWVDYAAVTRLKIQALSLAWPQFIQRGAADPEVQAFNAFIQEGGESLQHQALFDALHADQMAQDSGRWGWPVWPEALQHPGSPAVQTFLKQHEDQVRFWLWLQWLAAQHEMPTPPFALQSEWRSNMSRAEYGEKFARVQAYLSAGDCYQINLTQRFSAAYCGDEWPAYQVLSRANRAPFSAFVRLPQSAILSLSPERFLLLDDRHIETKPIKGTRPRLADPQQDQASALELAGADKDRSENLMIVDLLRNDIGRVSRPGSVSVPSLFAVESFPAVHHLVSTIHGELDNRWQAVDLLRACFPGGSITGAPKIRAMEIIEELEPQRRNAYCGSIGYLSQHGRMDTSICIRTLIAADGQLHCWAGGGIIADSDVDSEYQETYDKVARILPLLETLKSR